MSPTNKPTRYSNTELKEFELLIQKKMDKCQFEMKSLRNQIEELGESMGSDRSDFVDSTNTQSEGELLRTMLHRVEKYYRDLENALSRIRNASYGICSVSGELIDKRRLLAVPTTTKSVAVKLKPPKRKRVSSAAKKVSSAKAVRGVKSTKSKKAIPPIVLPEDEVEEVFDAEAAELNESELKAINEEFAGGASEESTGFKDLPEQKK